MLAFEETSYAEQEILDQLGRRRNRLVWSRRCVVWKPRL